MIDHLTNFCQNLRNRLFVDMCILNDHPEIPPIISYEIWPSPSRVVNERTYVAKWPADGNGRFPFHMCDVVSK